MNIKLMLLSFAMVLNLNMGAVSFGYYSERLQEKILGEKPIESPAQFFAILQAKILGSKSKILESKPVVSPYVAIVDAAYDKCIDDSINFYINGGSRKRNVFNKFMISDSTDIQVQIAEDIVQVNTASTGDKEVKIFGSAERDTVDNDEANGEVFKKDLAGCKSRRKSALDVLNEVLS